MDSNTSCDGLASWPAEESISDVDAVLMDGVGEVAEMTEAAETIGWNGGGVVVVDVAVVGGVEPMDGDHVLLGALCLVDLRI